jgi:nicotinamidase-related amidase
VAKTHKSLLEIVGASLEPSPFNEAALILIDFQREYTDGGLGLEGTDAAIKEAKDLLNFARKTGAPVFHVVHNGAPGGALFDPVSDLVEIVAPLAPLSTENVVVKKLPNAFAGTDLDTKIRLTGRKQLIVAGFMSHMCVSSTVRAALDLGYRSTVVASACATRSLSGIYGEVIEAATINSSAMAALADRFAIIVPDAATLAPISA